MRPEQEIARIIRDNQEHWPKWENHPALQKVIADNDPVRFAELLAMLIHGNFPTQWQAHQSTHPIRALIEHEIKDFDTVESARKYIAQQKVLNPKLRVDGIYRENKDRTIDFFPI